MSGNRRGTTRHNYLRQNTLALSKLKINKNLIFFATLSLSQKMNYCITGKYYKRLNREVKESNITQLHQLKFNQCLHMQHVSPVKVLSHFPAFHSFISLSADAVNISPWEGMRATSHTAASWPSSVSMQRSFSQTFAVQSQDPLKRVPNFPDARAQTATETGQTKLYRCRV